MNQESSHQTVQQPWNSTKNPESKGFVNVGVKDATSKGDYIKKKYECNFGLDFWYMYLGSKLAIIINWVVCGFKEDFKVTYNLSYIQTGVKAADRRVLVDLISILNLMKFWVNKRMWWLPRCEIMKGPQWQENKNWCCRLGNMYCYIPCGERKKQTRVALWTMLQVRFSSRTDYAMIALSDTYEEKERGHRHRKSTLVLRAFTEDMG